MSDSAAGRPSSGQVIRRHGPALAVYLAVALAILSGIHRLDRLATHTIAGDALVHTYIVNWGQHTLWRAPWNYYHAPLFHPEPTATALNASNPVLAFITGPYRAFGNPMLGFRLAMLTAALLSGLSMYATAWCLLRHRRAAVFAAVVYSCNGDMLWHLPGHPNISAPYFLPLVFLAYILFRRTGRARWAVLWGVFLLGQFFTSWYLGFISLFGVLTIWGVDLLLSRKRPGRGDVLLAGVLCVVLALVYVGSTPFREVTARHGSARGLHAAAALSADPVEYFVPPREPGRNQTIAGAAAARVLPWQPRLENAQFFGYLAWAFALIAAGGAIRRTARRQAGDLDPIILMAAAAGAVGMILSFGPFLWIGGTCTTIPMPFRAIYEFVPPLRFLRAPARFALLPGFAVALLGAAYLARAAWFNRPGPAKRRALLALLLGIIILEFRPISCPPEYEYGAGAREAIAHHRDLGVMAPVPFGDMRFLLDGAGVFPVSPSGWEGGIGNHRYDRLLVLMRDFPRREVLARHAALGVRALVVYDEENVAAARRLDQLQLLEEWNGGALFVLEFDDEQAIARAREEVLSLPDRPPLDEVAELPAEGVELLAAPVEFRARELFLPHIVAVEPMRMNQAGAFSLRVATRDPGVDFTAAEVYWRTVEDPLYRAEKRLQAFYNADGTMKTVLFDTSRHPDWDEDYTLIEVRVHFTASPWPGQLIRAESFRLYRREK